VPINRRKFLGSAALLGLGAAAAAAWRYWPEQGLFNPCRATLPRGIAEHELVRTAWEGIDPAKVWDSHSHLVGTGDSGSGIVINPRMESLLNPKLYAQRLFFLNAGCAHGTPGRVDQSYIERMHNLIDGMHDGSRRGVKLILFAFDGNVTARGEVDWERTDFFVPNRYAAEVARKYPEYFEWAASVHPYRLDAPEQLEWCAANGARAVKWLPAAMGIDPAGPKCDRFYEALVRLGLPLITHAGLERSVEGGDAQELGNPLRLRRPLEQGVRVVVAHCASMGQDRDIDRRPNGPAADSFELFARLMDEPRWDGRLFGDISAMTQLNRAGPSLARVIERSDWHPRLLNGSDYPLPGVMPLYSIDYLVSLGFVPPVAAPVLKAIREHNPLLFDFVLKRHLASNGRRFSARIFETREFFEWPVGQAGPGARTP